MLSRDYLYRSLVVASCFLAISLEGSFFSSKHLTYQQKKDGVSLEIRELTNNQRKDLLGWDFNVHLKSSKMTAVQIVIENNGLFSVTLDKNSLSLPILNKQEIEDAFLSSAKFTRAFSMTFGIAGFVFAGVAVTKNLPLFAALFATFGAIDLIGGIAWNGQVKEIPNIVKNKESIVQGEWNSSNILVVAPGEKKIQTIFVKKKKLLNKGFLVSLKQPNSKTINFDVLLSY
ncbi:MAG TPA: hypothetical protein QGF02_00985 [Candidatus Babeliales bacterium]|nr:hypothetical protein [Candidatus Babeliales bacterium]